MNARPNLLSGSWTHTRRISPTPDTLQREAIIGRWITRAGFRPLSKLAGAEPEAAFLEAGNGTDEFWLSGFMRPEPMRGCLKP